LLLWSFSLISGATKLTSGRNWLYLRCRKHIAGDEWGICTNKATQSLLQPDWHFLAKDSIDFQH